MLHNSFFLHTVLWPGKLQTRTGHFEARNNNILPLPPLIAYVFSKMVLTKQILK